MNDKPAAAPRAGAAIQFDAKIEEIEAESDGLGR
jgi:hypothetical protein